MKDMTAEQDMAKGLRIQGRLRKEQGLTSLSGQYYKAAKMIKQRAAELERLLAIERRFLAMLPLFEEARDALPAITTQAAKLHNISPTLADRMDDVGIKERWDAAEAGKEQP